MQGLQARDKRCPICTNRLSQQFCRLVADCALSSLCTPLELAIGGLIHLGD
jgi:hypothetical protein